MISPIYSNFSFSNTYEPPNFDMNVAKQPVTDLSHSEVSINKIRGFYITNIIFCLLSLMMFSFAAATYANCSGNWQNTKEAIAFLSVNCLVAVFGIVMLALTITALAKKMGYPISMYHMTNFQSPDSAPSSSAPSSSFSSTTAVTVSPDLRPDIVPLGQTPFHGII